MSRTIAVFGLTVSRLLFLAGAAGAVPDTVRVLYAQPFSYATSGFSWYQAYIYVHAKNIGTPASRHVYLHYNSSGTWLDEELNLVGDYGDHSLYSVTHPSAQVEFAVSYVSSAGTYWDNNDNANYRIQPWSSSGGFQPGVVGYEVGLADAAVSDYAYFTGTGWATAARLTAQIAVENLSYNKQVGIRYSVNAGTTWQDVNGTYQYTVDTGGGYRIEYWQVQASGLPYGGAIRYAVYYRKLDAPTAEFWDNNFSQNYGHALTTGNHIR